MSKVSPRPWQFKEHVGLHLMTSTEISRYVVCDSHGIKIAEVFYRGDARLISSVPDLLLDLKALVAIIEMYADLSKLSSEIRRVVARANANIAKAQGRDK